MSPPAPKRITYQATSPARRLNRDREVQDVLAMLAEIVQDETRRSRAKRLFLIQGDAGVGKSWFMECLREHIQTTHPTWLVAGNYEAQDFIGTGKHTPYYNFLAVLQSCDRALNLRVLDALPIPSTPTIQEVADWAGQLEGQLTKAHSGPLLLFFDELEWWVGVDGAQRETLNEFFRIVWQMLLRKAHIPCIIICAARRPPSFNNPLLRLALTTYELHGFPTSELEKLVEHHADVTPIRPLIDRNAHGNPWITQLFDIHLSPDPSAFHRQSQRDEIRRKIFGAVVSDRLPPTLRTVLYDLAEQKPGGFQPEDPLLPAGHETLNHLIASSFVEYYHDARCYKVAPVLAGLFRSNQDDPQQ